VIEKLDRLRSTMAVNVLKWLHCFTTVISNSVCCQKNISVNEVVLSGARICCVHVVRW